MRLKLTTGCSLSPRLAGLLVSLSGIKSQKWETLHRLPTPWQPFHNLVLSECSAKYSEALQQLASIAHYCCAAPRTFPGPTDTHCSSENGLPPSNGSSNQTRARQSHAWRTVAMEKGPEQQQQQHFDGSLFKWSLKDTVPRFLSRPRLALKLRLPASD